MLSAGIRKQCDTDVQLFSVMLYGETLATPARSEIEILDIQIQNESF